MDGYSVIARDSTIQHRIRVAVFYRSSPHYALEAVQKFGPNFVGFQLAAGEQGWYIIRYYLTPNNTLTIESFVAALKECPRGTKMLVEGDLNVKLGKTELDQKEDVISEVLKMIELKYMLAHFLPRQNPWCRGGRMWSMVCEGREGRSWTDYILGTDRCLFWNVTVRNPTITLTTNLS